MNEEEKKEKELWNTVAKASGEERVDALIQLSYSAYGKGNHKESLALCETARDDYEKLGANASTATLAHIYYGIAWSLNQLERPIEAVAAMDKSLYLFREIGSSEVINALKSEGDFYVAAKDYEHAYEVYSAITKESDPEINDSQLAWGYDNAGFALMRLKKWDKAIVELKQAREHYKKAGNPELMAHIDEEIAACYYWLGDGTESEFYANKAMDFAVTAENEFHTMWATIRQGQALKAQERFDEALEKFETGKSMLVNQQKVSWRAVVRVMKFMMEIYIIKGQMDAATDIERRMNSLAEVVFEEGDEI